MPPMAIMAIGGLFTLNLQKRDSIADPNATYGVGGLLKSGLFGRQMRQDLNHPPAPLAAFRSLWSPGNRLDLKHPPISIGGILSVQTELA
jgi:hypothetical protein